MYTFVQTGRYVDSPCLPTESKRNFLSHHLFFVLISSVRLSPAAHLNCDLLMYLSVKG